MSESALNLYSIPPVALDFSDGNLRGVSVVEIVRRIGDLAGVFRSEKARASLPQDQLVYRVQHYCPVKEGTAGGLFFGATFLEPGVVEEEYFMTKGHFHARLEAGEYYWCHRGRGMLLLMDEQRRCRAEEMSPGTLHYIPGRMAHRVVNTGDVTLCFGACWPADAGHDYQRIAKGGFSRRVVRIGGEPMLVEGER